MLTLLNLELPPMSAVMREKKQAAQAQRVARLRRTYNAAQVTRLNQNWSTAQSNANGELRRSLRPLRARSRELARNNDYFKKFLALCRTNVVGAQGITLQCKIDSTVGTARMVEKQVEAAWKQWCKPATATLTGKLSFTAALHVFIKTLARDGEALCRLCPANNAFGFSLKFIDVNWLDETHNEILSNGNRVLLGVEVNDDDRPVAYWLTRPTTDYNYMLPRAAQERYRTRVPAEEIIHTYLITEDETQTRGIPWAHTAMQRLHDLGDYEYYELIAAKVGAGKLGFYIPPQDEIGGETDEEFTFDDVEPGSCTALPPGYDFKTFDPNHPNQAYKDFTKGMLRGLSSGLEVAYSSLSGDLESVNFSSIRTGMLEERDFWRVLQGFAIETFCARVYPAWLENAVLSGALMLSPRDLQRVADPLWHARGWDWVDPQKDITADILAIENGLKTRTEVLAERGRDFEETLEQLAKEKQLAEKYSITFAGLNPQITPASNPAEPSDDPADSANEEQAT